LPGDGCSGENIITEFSVLVAANWDIMTPAE
jgi:hypothetical protein